MRLRPRQQTRPRRLNLVDAMIEIITVAACVVGLITFAVWDSMPPCIPSRRPA